MNQTAEDVRLINWIYAATLLTQYRTLHGIWQQPLSNQDGEV